MRTIIKTLFCAILLTGCAGPNSHTANSGPPKPAQAKPVVTPNFRSVGKVAAVDPNGRFVIISFSPGELPQADARLNIYHNGLKAAEVKVDGQWQRDNNTVADIITGSIQAGDEARQD